MQTIITTAFNLLPDGSVVLDGEHAPGVSAFAFGQLGIATARIGLGHYRVSAPFISIPTGWHATVYKDDNDLPTVHLSIQSGDGVIDVFTTDTITGAAKDVIYMLTLRVAVTVDASTLTRVDAEAHATASTD
ncbi:hypothetical protein [Dyella silvatica]|uniref:hypothetical protein n=1 Tax=Dyella silvatica TaxID=2992128 RepID=UPI002252BC1B|nr:hypothetical protein [Dyella silvatica]